jgi:hypothetical protein
MKRSEEHTLRMEHVYQKFEKANLLLQPAKCEFVKPEVQYLGHVIYRDGVIASPNKVKAMRDYPTLKNVRA